MSFSKFMKLATELQEQVVLSCAAREQLAFAQTCSSLHDISIHALYYHVDISTHNMPGLFPTNHGCIALAENPDVRMLVETEQCLKRQQLFLDALTVHPEYAARVKGFTWTYYSECDPYTDEQVSDQPTWNILRTLRSVKFLDFASLAFQRERDAPPALFPVAEHVRLVGLMSFAFVRAILFSIQPERLVSLDLDNLQDLGQLREGEDLDSMADLSQLPESEDAAGNPILRHPGNMRGHLRHLEGRCTTLKSLSLRSVGNDFRGDRYWSAAIDEARYKEWANFISSVRHTVERLTIEQGLEPRSNSTWPRPGQRAQYGRPMDDRFMEYLLPTLLTGTWPRLKEVRIYGIGSLPRREVVGYFVPKHPAPDQVARDRLSAALGPQVTLDIQEQALKTFFHRLHGNTYDT